MDVYRTDRIRNVVLLGHGGAGKTTLVEAMAYLSGMTSRLGKVSDGNTVSDFDKEEIKRQFSISTSVVPIQWNDMKINILDTPGFFDFVGEAEEAAAAADAAVIVVSGKSGVQVGTQKAWDLCEKYKLPRMIFVTEMDIDNVSYRKVVEDLIELYGKKVAPLHMPIRENEKFVGYINILKNKGRRYTDKDKKVECEIPEYSKEYLDKYRESLLESVAETSEEFMDRYFAGEEEALAVYRKERSLCFQKRAETLTAAVCKKNEGKGDTTAQMDKLFLRKRTGVPLMLLLLALVFWITAVGANVPSQMLMSVFTKLGATCRSALESSPVWLESLLMDGVFLTVSWVVSVMLPPMAIFFPMFTLLEDCGLLPRIAFQLDGLFRRAGAHGKQALTLCMGFGCNAAGVTACRIIDSPRERLIAILTNNFVPCNGRFPTILLLIAVFLSVGKPWMSGLALFVVIGLSVGMTLLVSFFLSRTVLRGLPSAFVLELPPFRRPQIGQVLVRSLLDRTIFVLGRAITAAAPAGAIIWLLQRIQIGDGTLLTQIAMFLEPLGGIMGLSGPILLAFLLGLPANEIVLPILLMFYSQSGMLVEGGSQTGAMLAANGWTWTTAVCAILFSLNHFPCATTLLTIRKETGSWKWTAISFLLPTIIGICLCAAVHGLFCFFGLT